MRAKDIIIEGIIIDDFEIDEDWKDFDFSNEPNIDDVKINNEIYNIKMINYNNIIFYGLFSNNKIICFIGFKHKKHNIWRAVNAFTHVNYRKRGFSSILFNWIIYNKCFPNIISDEYETIAGRKLFLSLLKKYSNIAVVYNYFTEKEYKISDINTAVNGVYIMNLNDNITQEQEWFYMLKVS